VSDDQRQNIPRVKFIDDDQDPGSRRPSASPVGDEVRGFKRWLGPWVGQCSSARCTSRFVLAAAGETNRQPLFPVKSRKQFLVVELGLPFASRIRGCKTPVNQTVAARKQGEQPFAAARCPRLAWKHTDRSSVSCRSATQARRLRIALLVDRLGPQASKTRRPNSQTLMPASPRPRPASPDQLQETSRIEPFRDLISGVSQAGVADANTILGLPGGLIRDRNPARACENRNPVQTLRGPRWRRPSFWEILSIWRFPIPC